MPERVVPTSVNVVVCAVLLGLTLVTTLLGRLDLDPFNLAIALAIAGGKALLIMLYFMHIRWSPKVMRLVVAGGVLWFTILLLGVMDDYMTRAWPPIPGK